MRLRSAASFTTSVQLVCLLLSVSILAPPVSPTSGYALANNLRTLSKSVPKQDLPPQSPAQGELHPDQRAGELLVRFRPTVPEEEKAALAVQVGAQRQPLRGSSGIERLSISTEQNTEAVAVTLASNPAVEFIEPNYIITADEVTPNDPRFAEQWALWNKGQSSGATGADIGMTPAWIRTTGSPKTVVAVIDSGVDFTHPDLHANQWTNRVEPARNHVAGRGYTKDQHGWDFVTDSNEIKDEQGHGTAVAGLIAARGNNGIGITGVMWRASLMSLRVLDNKGTGDVASAIEAIDYAVAHNAQIVNCSWGTDHASQALRAAMAHAVNQGIIFICAAGNGGRYTDQSPHYPAAYEMPNVISVAATDQFDALTEWTNWGSNDTTLAAPGVHLLTTKPGGGYDAVSGSSASAALVTGVVGLVKTLRPHLSAALTRAALMKGVRPLAGLAGRVGAGGVVSADGALAALDALSSGEGMTAGDEQHQGDTDDNNAEKNNRNGGGPDAALSAATGQVNVNAGQERPPRRGRPSLGLPDLNVARRHQPERPHAPDSIRSTLRNCPPHNHHCNEIGGQATRTPPPPVPHWASPDTNAQPVQIASASSPQPSRRSLADFPLFDFNRGGSNYSTSDTPFALSWFAHSFKGTGTTPNLLSTALVSFNDATFDSQSVPNPMIAGQTYAVAVTLRNTGDTTWTPDALYHLGAQSPQDVSVWRLGRVQLPVAAVAPQANVTFNFNVTAPTAAGVYDFRWQMVQDGFQWFGQITPNPNNVQVTVNAPTYEGWLDGATCTVISGWAWLVNQPNTPIEVDVFADGNFVARVPADQYRQDLVAAGKGNGRHGFSLQTPAALLNGAVHQISARIANSTFLPNGAPTLSGSPKSVGGCPPPGTALPQENVMWRNAVGVLAAGNTLTKNAPDGWGNAGASSTKLITSGDGYVEFTATEANTARMCGLSSSGDANQNYLEVNYAIYLTYDGNVAAYESGNYNAYLGTYMAGDRFRVSIESGAVKYYKNGGLLYTSTIAPSYPLRVDTSLGGPGATITAAIIGGTLANLNPTLTAYWKFDENGGTTTADASGNGHTGTLQSATWAAGRIGSSALSFNGAGANVNAGAAADLAMTNAMSVSAWLYPTGTGTAGIGGIIVNKEGEYEIARFADGTIEWAFANSNPGWAWINTGYVAPLNQWTHVAVVYDNGTVRTYANGVLVHTYAGTGVISDVSPTQNEFRIGGRQCCAQDFQGSIDDVRLYNGVLAAADIAAQAGAGGEGVPTTPPPAAAARLNPRNRTGAAGTDLLSGNFNWTLPLLHLPGRAGLDLDLALAYNSLVWTKDGTTIQFNADDGFPAPGFRLGFPVIQPRFYNAQTGRYAYLLVTPGGARVELRQMGGTSTYEAADASYLQLIDYGGTMLLRTPDGTQLSYWPVGGAYRCTMIKDRNGNYLTVGYDSQGGLLSVTDTLGRAVKFTYDDFHNLLSITQVWHGQTHVWATFGYAAQAMSPGFTGLTVQGPQGGQLINVLRQVGLQDGSRYQFDYNAYGQVQALRRYSADNHQLAYTTYTLPATSGDCPRVNDRHDWALEWNEGLEAVTTYGYDQNGTWGETIMPDGTRHRETFGTSWQQGLTVLAEEFAANNPAAQKTTTLTWAQDNQSLAYQENPRVMEANVTDASNNHRRTTVGYNSVTVGATACHLPETVREYAADATTVLRRTVTLYSWDQALMERRVIGLVGRRAVYEGESTLVSLEDYIYDWVAGYMSASAPTVQHDTANYGTNLGAGRGFLVAVFRYNVNDTSQGIWAQTFGYNLAGETVWAADAANHRTNISYSDSFVDQAGSPNASNPFAPGTASTLAYPTTVTNPDGYQTFIKYDYDMGAVRQQQTPPSNSTSPTDYSGPKQTTAYDEAGRVVRVSNSENVNAANAAYTRYVYAPGQNWVQSFSLVQDTTPLTEAYAIQVFDGAGRTYASAGAQPGSTGGYSGRHVVYDVMGRVVKSSNPTEMTSAWEPVGDDDPNKPDDPGGWYYATQDYDWKGRPTYSTNPNGSFAQELIYGGCGCAGGEVVTVRDGVGRQQKVYHDVLGRAWKTEVLDSVGNVYAATTNKYNALDQITRVREYQGGAPNPEPTLNEGSTYQTTTLDYDGHGRLLKRHAPEQDASKFTEYSYWDDDTVRTVKDARGVVTSFNYNSRHLATSVTYNTDSVPAPTPTPSSAVGYGYDAAGNRLSMTDGFGSVDYHYNARSQMDWESRQFSAVSNPTAGDGKYKLSYSYTLGGALKSITDPFGAQINYTYDSVERLTDVTGTTFGGITRYASELQYRAWGSAKHLKYGDDDTLDVGYNRQLSPAQYDLKNSAGTRLMGATYSYYGDGRLRFVDDLREDRFDRLYEYDQAGRVTKSVSGWQARTTINPNDSAQNGPYNHFYGYDALNKLTSRTGSYWYSSNGENYTASYANNRNQNSNWLYDADGRLTQSVVVGSTTTYNQTYTYDAAGNRADVGQYDGDGRRVKATAGQFYDIHSSMLGGQTVTEIFSETYPTVSVRGKKSRTYVYLGGEAVADQYVSYIGDTGTEHIKWRRQDPARTSVHERDPYRMAPSQESGVQSAVDMQGIATEAPDYTRLTQQPSYYSQQYSYYNYGGMGSGYYSSGSGGGIPGNFGSGCSVGGVPISCSAVVAEQPVGVLRTYTQTYAPDGTVRTTQTGAQLIPFNYNLTGGGGYEVPFINRPTSTYAGNVYGSWTVTNNGRVVEDEAGDNSPQTNLWIFNPFSANSFSAGLTGTSPQNPGTSPQNPFSGRPLLNSAVATAISLLRSSKCRGLFSANVDPVALLQDLAAGKQGVGLITFINLGAPKETDGRVSIAMSGGVAGNAIIAINDNPKAPFRNGYAGYGDYHVNDALRRALTLIHELGHAARILKNDPSASKIVPDGASVDPGGNRGLSQGNSARVYNACILGVDKEFSF